MSMLTDSHADQSVVADQTLSSMFRQIRHTLGTVPKEVTSFQTIVNQLETELLQEEDLRKLVERDFDCFKKQADGFLTFYVPKVETLRQICFVYRSRLLHMMQLNDQVIKDNAAVRAWLLQVDIDKWNVFHRVDGEMKLAQEVLHQRKLNMAKPFYMYAGPQADRVAIKGEIDLVISQFITPALAVVHTYIKWGPVDWQTLFTAMQRAGATTNEAYLFAVLNAMYARKETDIKAQLTAASLDASPSTIADFTIGGAAIQPPPAGHAHQAFYQDHISTHWKDKGSAVHNHVVSHAATTAMTWIATDASRATLRSHISSTPHKARDMAASLALLDQIRLGTNTAFNLGGAAPYVDTAGTPASSFFALLLRALVHVQRADTAHLLMTHILAVQTHMKDTQTQMALVTDTVTAPMKTAYTHIKKAVEAAGLLSKEVNAFVHASLQGWIVDMQYRKTFLTSIHANAAQVTTDTQKIDAWIASLQVFVQYTQHLVPYALVTTELAKYSAVNDFARPANFRDATQYMHMVKWAKDIQYRVGKAQTMLGIVDLFE